MKRIVIIAAVLLAVVLLAACDRTRTPTQVPEQTTEQKTEEKTTAQTMKAPFASDAADPRRFAEDSLSFLQTNIDEPTSFSSITDAFAALCAEPTADEEILFEAGTYTINDKTRFIVSLVRQIPDGKDEFYQIRAELSFEPDEENGKIEETKWFDPTEADAFSAIRSSAAFAYADSHNPVSVDMYIGET